MKSVLSLSILIAASVVATAQGTSLLDGVLAEETPASMPAPAEESGTKEVPSDETVKTEEQADSADGEDIRTLREEVAALRQELDRHTSHTCVDSSAILPSQSSPRQHLPLFAQKSQVNEALNPQTLMVTMVEIPGKNFSICRYEVTQALWEAVMGWNPSHFKGTDLPVENVSWSDCKWFLEELNALLNLNESSRPFRLPTVEEWEYAYRAGATDDYCKFEDGQKMLLWDLSSVAWVCDNAKGTTHSIGQKKPNAFGLHDMIGNVWEWTDKTVVLGGGWNLVGAECADSFRRQIKPRNKSEAIGFRLAR